MDKWRCAAGPKFTTNIDVLDLRYDPRLCLDISPIHCILHLSRLHSPRLPNNYHDSSAFQLRRSYIARKITARPDFLIPSRYIRSNFGNMPEGEKNSTDYQVQLDKAGVLHASVAEAELDKVTIVSGTTPLRSCALSCRSYVGRCHVGPCSGAEGEVLAGIQAGYTVDIRYCGTLNGDLSSASASNEARGLDVGCPAGTRGTRISEFAYEVMPSNKTFLTHPSTVLTCQLPGHEADYSACTFCLAREDHTLGNALRWMIMKE